MARVDLVAALRNAVERGETLEEARLSLLNANYSPSEVDEAAREIERLKPKKLSPPSKRTEFPPLPSPPRA
ncbi:MAG: hypothetical protein ACPLXC_02620 [Candidatus Pacearchaeota archaeon]